MSAAAVLSPVAAEAAQPLPTLTVTMTRTTITTSAGSTVHAGRMIIKVLAVGGEHDLALGRFAPGYTLPKAAADLNKMFSGDLSAVHRVDANIRFLGGASAVPGQPGWFAETLYAGTYQLLDSSGAAHNVLRVVGTPPRRGWVNQTSTIIGDGNDRFVMPASIPHAGWTLFRDTSDEPHFLVFQQVKPGTTVADIGRFLASGSQSEPAFALGAHASSGVISGGTQMLWNYSLPRGLYAVLCFWPGDKTGMPHANMGMYKLVTLS